MLKLKLMVVGVMRMGSLVRWWWCTAAAATTTAVVVYAEYVRIGPGHTALGLGVDVAPGGRMPVVDTADTDIVATVSGIVCHIGRGQREGDDPRPPRHVGLAQLPVHCFRSTPGDLHLLCHLGPHFWLEPVEGRASQQFSLVLVFFPLLCLYEIGWGRGGGDFLVDLQESCTPLLRTPGRSAVVYWTLSTGPAPPSFAAQQPSC